MTRSPLLRLGEVVINFAHLISVKKADQVAVHLTGYVLHLDGPDAVPCWDFVRHLAALPHPLGVHHIAILEDQAFDFARLLVARRRPAATAAPDSAAHDVELVFVGGHSETVCGAAAGAVWTVLRGLARTPPGDKR